MKYNNLGRAGIKVSELSFGSWITFAKQLVLKDIKEFMHTAFDHGVNFFDNAESYAHGEAEILMGKILKDFRREDLVISTKIFWGGHGPNDAGLSRKHLLEGTYNSLARLGLDYIDLLFCHRPDPATPVEETVLAMDYLIRQGYILYWGTSEWPADRIKAAFDCAKALNCMPPTMEQAKYNIFAKDRVETEYSPLVEQYGLGLTTWSPLASGILSGKYTHGIPQHSRLAQENWLVPDNFSAQVAQAEKLTPIANELGCTLSQLALCWCLQNPDVSSVITGASTLEQLIENLCAVDFKDKITPDIYNTIVSWGKI